MIIYVSNGYVFYALTYLELFPDYICPESNPKCDHTDRCKDPSIQINWTSTRSLHNWVETLGLECMLICFENVNSLFLQVLTHIKSDY